MRRQVLEALLASHKPLGAYEIIERLAHRGEPSADVVVVHGSGKETLRLFGTPYSVNRVRAAMFSAAIHWTPIELD
jgi:predicted esterase